MYFRVLSKCKLLTNTFNYTHIHSLVYYSIWSTNERVTNKFLLFLFQVRNHPRQTSEEETRKKLDNTVSRVGDIRVWPRSFAPDQWSTSRLSHRDSFHDSRVTKGRKETGLEDRGRPRKLYYFTTLYDYAGDKSWRKSRFQIGTEFLCIPPKWENRLLLHFLSCNWRIGEIM